VKKYNFFYEGNGALLLTVFQADDEDHAWEQYHSEQGDEAPTVRLVLVGEIEVIFQE
jgi:hypothetical protein